MVRIIINQGNIAKNRVYEDTFIYSGHTIVVYKEKGHDYYLAEINGLERLSTISYKVEQTEKDAMRLVDWEIEQSIKREQA